MCGVELFLCLACGGGAGALAAWKARGALTQKGKVVTDQQGRVVGKNGQLLKDKKGRFVHFDKDVKDKQKPLGQVADSGETHLQSAEVDKKVKRMAFSRLPWSKRALVENIDPKTMAPPARAPPREENNGGGTWRFSKLTAWMPAGKGNQAVQA